MKENIDIKYINIYINCCFIYKCLFLNEENYSFDPAMLIFYNANVNVPKRQPV